LRERERGVTERKQGKEIRVKEKLPNSTIKTRRRRKRGALALERRANRSI
jgi:hypothetical protein